MIDLEQVEWNQPSGLLLRLLLAIDNKFLSKLSQNLLEILNDVMLLKVVQWPLCISISYSYDYFKLSFSLFFCQLIKRKMMELWYILNCQTSYLKLFKKWKLLFQVLWLKSKFVWSSNSVNWILISVIISLDPRIWN